MENLISVIIPVCNVSAYLRQCLDSVLSQDHRDLEVILIDDGSTDASGEICDEYAARDDRVRVIHQKNGGAASAKNAGLRIATGEYLSFVDSDDYLEPGAYRYMLAAMAETGADAGHFSFREVYRDRVEEQHLPTDREVLDNRTYLARFTKDWSCPLLWNKLYKRSLFVGVFFEEGHKIDDEYFTYQGFLKESTVVCDDRIVYNYRRRASSVMSTPQAAEQRMLDCLDSVQKRREKVLHTYPQLRKVYDENYLDTLWYLSGNEGNTQRTLQLLKDTLRAYFREKGNSFPPRYLWRKLFGLYTLSVETQLERCMAIRPTQAPEDHFE